METDLNYALHTFCIPNQTWTDMNYIDCEPNGICLKADMYGGQLTARSCVPKKGHDGIHQPGCEEVMGFGINKIEYSIYRPMLKAYGQFLRV